MDEMEEKLGAILRNPQLMQQVMDIAQTLNQGDSKQDTPEPVSPPEPESPPLPNIDLSLIRNLSGLAGQSGIDREQKALLHALGPYLSRQRVDKLERAMRAAKMAKLASAFIGQGGLSFLTGR